MTFEALDAVNIETERCIEAVSRLAGGALSDEEYRLELLLLLEAIGERDAIILKLGRMIMEGE